MSHRRHKLATIPPLCSVRRFLQAQVQIQEQRQVNANQIQAMRQNLVQSRLPDQLSMQVSSQGSGQLKGRLLGGVLMAAMWSSVLAGATEQHQSALPNAPQASIQNTTPMEVCGEAKLSVLFWDVYESTLFTPRGQWHPGVRPLRLEIRYLRDIAAEDLIEQTRKEWQSQRIHSERHEAWLLQLGEQWRDVTEGDRVALAIDEQGVSTFYFNDEPIGLIIDPQFGEDFSGIWLSPNTTRPELRSALIGADNEEA